MLYQGKVTKVSKLKNSYNGNPRFAVWLEGIGRFTTPIDAGWVYGCSFHNYVGRRAMLWTGTRMNSRTMQGIQVEGVR